MKETGEIKRKRQQQLFAFFVKKQKNKILCFEERMETCVEKFFVLSFVRVC